MHPHLVGDRKMEHCARYIQALDECHARGWLHKLTGGCNGVKHELNMCLRRERLERTAEHVKEAKKNRKKTEQIWKDLDDES